MARNSGEIAAALRRADRSVPRSLRSAGRSITRDLEQATSTPYPPASRPGNPPHSRTGRLRSSFRHVVVGTVLELFNTVPYFRFVQPGTRKMAARPSLGPVVERSAPEHVPTQVGEGIVSAERRG